MANTALSTTYTTYTAIGQAEDVENEIYNISPEETPILSAIGRIPVDAVLHEWQTESLATASTANAQIQGLNYSTFPVVTPTVRVGNYTQIFTKLVSVSGTLVGPRQIEKLVEVDGFDIDLVPSSHMVFLHYHDKPGVVGTVGQLLGDAGINIAGMQVSRDEKGGHALMALTIDSVVPPAVLAGITDAIGAHSGRVVDLEG